MPVQHSPAAGTLPRPSVALLLNKLKKKLTPKGSRSGSVTSPSPIVPVASSDEEDERNASDEEDEADSSGEEDAGDEENEADEEDEEEASGANKIDSIQTNGAVNNNQSVLTGGTGITESPVPEQKGSPTKIYPDLTKVGKDDDIAPTQPIPLDPKVVVTPRPPARSVRKIRLPTRVQPIRQKTSTRFDFPEQKIRRPNRAKVPQVTPPLKAKNTLPVKLNKQEVKPTTLASPERSAMSLTTPAARAAYKKQFSLIYSKMLAGGVDAAQAQIYADGAALAMTQLLRGDEVAERAGKNHEAELWTGYYANQDQQQAISLLSSVSAFSGQGSVRFEDWIKQFESVLATAKWDEGKKISLLCSKLTLLVADCIDAFRQTHPILAKSYKSVKDSLQKRFHGGDNRVQYCTEYNHCILMPGETIRDYECRLQKLFLFAYPLGSTVATKELLDMRAKLVMDRFVDGLSPQLRKGVKYQDFPDMNSLIRATEMRAAAIEETKRAKRNEEYVNAVVPRPVEAIASSPGCLEVLLQENKQIAQMIAQTNAAIGALCIAMKNTPVGVIPGGALQAGRQNQRERNSYFCDYCNQPGHSRDRCRRDPGNVNCYNCNQPGHISRDCPQRRGPALAQGPQTAQAPGYRPPNVSLPPNIPRGQGN